MSATLAQDVASLTATATLGSVSHDLPGFSISQDTNNHVVAVAGNMQSAPRSFLITATASLGSISLDVGFG